MKTDLFTLKGILPPGRVDIYKHGVVTLTEIGDDKAMQLFKEGNCPYLEPTEKGLKILYPDQKPIEAEKIEVQEEEVIADEVIEVPENIIVQTKDEALALLRKTDDISTLDYSDQMVPMIKFLEIKTDNRKAETFVKALTQFKTSAI